MQSPNMSQYQRVLVEYQRGSTWISTTCSNFNPFLDTNAPAAKVQCYPLSAQVQWTKEIIPPTPHLLAPALNNHIFWGGGISNFCRVQVSYPSSV